MGQIVAGAAYSLASQLVNIAGSNQCSLSWRPGSNRRNWRGCHRSHGQSINQWTFSLCAITTDEIEAPVSRQDSMTYSLYSKVWCLYRRSGNSTSWSKLGTWEIAINCVHKLFCGHNVDRLFCTAQGDLTGRLRCACGMNERKSLVGKRSLSVGLFYAKQRVSAGGQSASSDHACWPTETSHQGASGAVSYPLDNGGCALDSPVLPSLSRVKIRLIYLFLR